MPQPPAEVTLPASTRGWNPRIGMVLGSGLGALVDAMADPEFVSFAEVEGLPRSAVSGHAGRFAYGGIGGVPVLVAQGRVHLYEGWSAAEVTAGVRAMGALGIEALVLTNAAGAINPEFPIGDWMMISDHLNLTGTSPLLGGANFHDMTRVYSSRWREALLTAARQREMRLHEGVYAGLVGPQYETPAEVRMLERLGADAVGMSTVLEAIQAHAAGIEVIGLSCLTNAAAGISGQPLDHSEVLSVGDSAARQLVAVLTAAIGYLNISS